MYLRWHWLMRGEVMCLRWCWLMRGGVMCLRWRWLMRWRSDVSALGLAEVIVEDVLAAVGECGEFTGSVPVPIGQEM